VKSKVRQPTIQPGLSISLADGYIAGMIVLTNTGGVAMTNCYLIADEAAKQAVMFDAPDHTTKPLLDEAVKRGWELTGLWLTHGHFDHFADHAVVKQRFPAAKVLIHPLDEAKTRTPEVQMRMFGIPLVIPPLETVGHVADNQKLKIGSMEVTVMHTPGHSPGHVVYYFPDQKLLIGGDLIIGGSVGRTDLPDSDYRQMEASLRRVMRLPDETRLLGGHGPATTLGSERATNPFLREVLGLAG
jgi:glyoxylase-like metal-dependent hydrolase (beta-lactamase superfamily II)